MAFGFKLLASCALAFSVVAACQPDLDSLSAEYTPTAGNAGTAGGSPEGGMGNAGGGAPVPAQCDNQSKDTNESDVDCGGSSKCKRCPPNGSCKVHTDCASSFCKGTRCAEPSCTDGVQNAEETATDCGGGCPGCDLDIACAVDDDCLSQFCKDEVCTDHCISGKREEELETDKDCGGPDCGPCGDGRRCVEASDCQSLSCSNSVCKAATCNDEILNQDESSEDCGGKCGPTCLLGERCNTTADCESWVCKANKCASDIVVPEGDVIDNFEDGDLLVIAQADRIGQWYAYGDGSGIATVDISAINRGVSLKGIHTTGKNFTGWGSGIGVDLHNTGSGQTTKAPYDASAYTGITFWGRVTADSLMVTVLLPDSQTDAAGGVCTTCDHHYFKPVTLTNTWQRYTVKFSELVVESGTIPIPTGFKPDGVVAVQFRLQGGTTYDVYVDDLAFVK